MVIHEKLLIVYDCNFRMPASTYLLTSITKESVTASLEFTRSKGYSRFGVEMLLTSLGKKLKVKRRWTFVKQVNEVRNSQRLIRDSIMEIRSKIIQRFLNQDFL